MTKISKFIISLFFVLAISLCLGNSKSVFAAVNVIDKIDVTVDENGKVTFEGTTIGNTTNMNILVKIFNGAELDFFDQVVVNGNSFKFSATPKTAEFETELTLIIAGDLNYSGTFFYSPKYSNNIQKVEQETIDLLQKYAIYYDDFISTKLKFDITTKFNGDVLFVYLYGTNFRNIDSNWRDKDPENWKTFLSTITTKGYELSGNKPVYVYVYDSDNNFLEAFPKAAYDAIEKDENSSGNNNSDKEKEIITDAILKEILANNSYYSAGNYTYFYEFSLIEANKNYIKVKAQGDFSKYDECWYYVKSKQLEAFFDTCALKIRSKYNVDIDFIIYDEDGKVLTGYSYYVYDEDEDLEEKTTSITTEEDGLPNVSQSTETKQPVIDEEFVPESTIVVKIPDEYELDPEYQFVPWNDKRATGLVLALHLADYGYNSASIIPQVKEGTTDESYIYDLFVPGSAIMEAINTLRHDSKKIVYLKKQTDSNNINLELPIETVLALKDAKALFIFDTDYYRIEMDFAGYDGYGPIVINTADAFMEADDYAKPLIITIKDNGKDANNKFDNGIKCLLHYESEKTTKIKDLRSINIFDSNGMIINSTSTTLEKGFIFRYNGADTYFAKNNQFAFTDDVKEWEDKMSIRKAELVVSKDIMPNKNNAEFNPSDTITRGEFIYYLACKMGAFSTTQRYQNVDSSNPYYEAINGIYELGIMPSSFRENLSSNKIITREEMIYMVVRCYEINNNNKTPNSAALLYRDKADISVWAKTKIGVASKLGLIEDDGYLYPNDFGTREFAANLLYQLLVAEGIF